MSSFPVAALVDYHGRGDVQQHRFILQALESGSLKPALVGYRPGAGRVGPPEAARGQSGPLSCQLPVAAAFLGLWPFPATAFVSVSPAPVP